MTLADLLAAFPGAQLLDIPAGSWPLCSVCGAARAANEHDHPGLCRRCTLHELGTTEAALSLSVEFHISLHAAEVRLEKYGPPHINPKAWLTPRSRLRY